MSINSIGDPIAGTRRDSATTETKPGSERDRLVRAAQEFESMLMLQMLKEMRKAGSWEDDEERESGGSGAQTMLETIDVELASHLAKAQSMGLSKQLVDALEGRVGRVLNSGPGIPGGSMKQDPPYALEIPSGQITSSFGWRSDPFHGAARFHRGIDVRAAYGQEIPSAASGRVVSAGPDGGYGTSVVVEHAGGVRTRYAHLSTTLVAAGDEVREGQAVGRAGHSGRATGTHLHFEVMAASGEPLNPEQFAGLKVEGAVADSSRGSQPVLQETRRDDFTN